jgi:hypothetical protein
LDEDSAPLLMQALAASVAEAGALTSADRESVELIFYRDRTTGNRVRVFARGLARGERLALGYSAAARFGGITDAW